MTTNLEEFITGYCRQLDRSRLVTVEAEDGEWNVDCGFGGCPYEPNCPIAQRIRELMEA